MSHAVTAVLYQHKNEGKLTACAISCWVSYTSLAMNMHNMHKHGNIRTQRNVHVHVIVHVMLCSLSICFL